MQIVATASRTCIISRLGRHAQQFAGVFIARSVEAGLVLAIEPVGTRGDSGQGGYLPPAERGPRGAILFADSMEEFLAVQSAIFADRVLDQRLEHTLHREALLAIDLDGSRGPTLVIRLDRILAFGQ